jgi:hypothetical protein
MGLLKYFDDDPMATAAGTGPRRLSGGLVSIVLRRIIPIRLSVSAQ